MKFMYCCHMLCGTMLLNCVSACSEQVKWSNVMDRSSPDPPTAVFLHGILGSRKNWGTHLVLNSFLNLLMLAE